MSLEYAVTIFSWEFCVLVNFGVGGWFLGI